MAAPKKTLLIMAVAACPAAASAQVSPQIIDFGQADVSSDTQTLVLVKALPYGQPKPDPLLTAAYTHWQDGWSASVGYMYRWGLTNGDHKWSVGAGAGGKPTGPLADDIAKTFGDFAAFQAQIKQAGVSRPRP